MRQDIITRAQNTITQRRISAENAYKEIVSPLYQDEEYVKLEREQTRLLIENAKREALGDKPDTKREKELSEKLLQIKTKHNLQNAKVEYSCNLCNDNGYINGQMCKCLKKELSKLLMQDSGFDKLESFNECTKTSGMEDIYKKMQEWCNKSSSKNLIYIAGPTGVGKTVLLRCMANELIENGKVVKITTAFNMNQDFKEFFKTRNEELINKYLSPEILFIDDLGTEPKYDGVTIECLYLLVNERKMKNLPTVITSNLDLADLRDRYDERIYSRIVDRNSSINIYLDGADKRIKK